tara:strand:+ start:216 stop:584 length:369 start_codon:yes stop_codon:yes gene_type:complete
MKKLLSILIFLIINSVGVAYENNKGDKILKNLRCLVCQGQTISDSNSDFAQIIKAVVNDKIKEGLSEKEIYSFLSEKYGDWILYNPPLKKNSLILWFLPYVLFIIGGIFIYFLIKKRALENK